MLPSCHSSQSTQSGRAPPQRHREDRQRTGSSCIRLQSPCRSTTYPRVALKDKISVKSTLFPKTLPRRLHMAFSTASCNIEITLMHSHVWSRAEHTMSNHTCCEECHHSEGTSVLGSVQSHFMTCSYFVICC